MKDVYPSNFSPWEILIATFIDLLLAKVPFPKCYTLGVS